MSVALPSWAERGGIPPLPPLDEALTRRLLEAAVREELEPDELAAIRTVCERVADPTAFLREMIERWQFKGAGEQFMSRVFGWLASEEDVLWLGDLMRRRKPWTDHTWARHLPRARAALLLAAADSPLAWLELMRFRDSTRVDDLFKMAREMIADAARDAGLRYGEDGGLGAPTLGFEDGERRLDEARGLTIIARDRDHVHLRRDNGRTFAQLPRAATSDDPDAVERSRQHWNLLRPAILEVFDRGAARLETAATLQRVWGKDVFRRDWLEHPLLGTYARRVVWHAYTERGTFAFLITAEDGPVRLDGTSLDLDTAWGFEVAHPTMLDAGWAQVVADLEIVQPFEQIHRGARSAEGKLNPDKLVEADRWGWERRARAVGDRRDILVLPNRSHTVQVYLAPGLAVSAQGRVVPQQEPQEIVRVSVSASGPKTPVEEADWPALVRMEVDLLKARTAL